MVIGQNKNAFIQWTSPDSNANCELPQVTLPVLDPSDLSFQFTLQQTALSSNPYSMNVIGAFYGNASFFGTQMTVLSVTNGQVWIGMPVYNISGNANLGYVTSFISGTGGTGTYGISKSYEFELPATVAGYDWPADEILNNTMLRTLAARVCLNCDEGVVLDPTINDFQWIATACMVTPGNNGLQLTWYFQFTGTLTEWNILKANQCFQICIYGVGLLQTYPQYANINPNMGGIYPYNTIAAIAPQIACSYTQFSKITEECDAYPSAVLQYANVSDAFGFFYDGLGQLTPPGINYLESIRLPLYLHSPEYAEEQMSYQLSDGSTLKLVHRIWTDYKFKTDYLDASTLNALVVATAHDFVFITSHYQGIDPWTGGAYQTGDVTQFVRNEKIEIEWQQETIPRFKLGQAKGTIRLAEPASNVNSNCV